MLVLAALAHGREVIISRGELVEIGGGFRVPDVMAQSGADAAGGGHHQPHARVDYAAAISVRTGLILRVHPSNFRIEGFTERPALARARSRWRAGSQVPVIEDIGSGWCGPLPLRVRSATSRRRAPAWRAGIDLVLFSGDKLLGGPQAGIVAGSAHSSRPHAAAPADARAAGGQADVRGARSDAGRVRRGPGP
jgi:L-seryl-tRNA(Ser) seleniumtransferase